MRRTECKEYTERYLEEKVVITKLLILVEGKGYFLKLGKLFGGG